MNSAGLNNLLLISPESGYGGSEKSFAQLSRILCRHYNIHIVFFGNSTDPTYPLGGNTIYLNTPAANNIIRSIINFIIRLKKIRAIKKNLNIVASISFLEGANYLNILTRKKEKCIISIRGSIIHDPNIKGFGRVFRRGLLIPVLYRKADKVICISRGLKDELMSFFSLENDKIDIIYNSINSREIEEKSKESVDTKYEAFFNDFTLISHSRISHEKGIQFQLLILNNLLKLIPDLKLVLIGDGPFKNKLINLCKELELQYYVRGEGNMKPSNCQVIFWGYTDNPFKLINKADMFISTSLTEGLGNSILEAMACRCLVVSSDCPYGPKEIIIPEKDMANSSKEYPVYHENGILMPVISHIGDKKSIDLWTSTIKDIILRGAMGHSVDAAFNRACNFNDEELEKRWLSAITRD